MLWYLYVFLSIQVNYVITKFEIKLKLDQQEVKETQLRIKIK